MVKCPECDGLGWTSEHSPYCSGEECESQGCPVQVQCKYCNGTGDNHVPPKYTREEIDSKKDEAIGRLINFVCSYNGPEWNDYECTLLDLVNEYRELRKLRDKAQ